jgi:hypothetical protein
MVLPLLDFFLSIIAIELLPTVHLSYPHPSLSFSPPHSPLWCFAQHALPNSPRLESWRSMHPRHQLYLQIEILRVGDRSFSDIPKTRDLGSKVLTFLVFCTQKHFFEMFFMKLASTEYFPKVDALLIKQYISKIRSSQWRALLLSEERKQGTKPSSMTYVFELGFANKTLAGFDGKQHPLSAMAKVIPTSAKWQTELAIATFLSKQVEDNKTKKFPLVYQVLKGCAKLSYSSIHTDWKNNKDLAEILTLNHA